MDGGALAVCRLRIEPHPGDSPRGRSVSQGEPHTEAHKLYAFRESLTRKTCIKRKLHLECKSVLTDQNRGSIKWDGSSKAQHRRGHGWGEGEAQNKGESCGSLWTVRAS